MGRTGGLDDASGSSTGDGEGDTGKNAAAGDAGGEDVGTGCDSDDEMCRCCVSVCAA